MGLVFGRQERTRLSELVSPRPGVFLRGLPYVSQDNALTHSAVWAAIRTRAMLISTFPVDAYRYADLGNGKVQINAALTPLLTGPEFMVYRYASQVELDRSGNAVSIIRQRSPKGVITELDLQPSSVVSARTRGSKVITWLIDGVEYDPKDIWHEVQYPAAGFALGLSPVAYSAYTLGQYKSIQEFATSWFTSGQGPRASLRNTEKKIKGREALVVKEAWRASQNMGEPFVHGNDWEYSLVQAQSASTDWLTAMKASNVDVARFYNVPAEVIDAAVSGESVTYANIVQRSLQFLIYHLGPTITWRENAFSELLPRPRFVKLNADALLRMDPKTRAETIRTQIGARTIAPSEVRALENRPPYTAEQIAEFNELGLNKAAQ